MSASFRNRAINVRTFWKLSYESQCTSSIWTECSKCCVVMLRFPCLCNTWALNFVMKYPCIPNQSIRAIIGGVHQLSMTKAWAESVPLARERFLKVSREKIVTPPPPHTTPPASSPKSIRSQSLSGFWKAINVRRFFENIKTPPDKMFARTLIVKRRFYRSSAV